MMRNLWGVALAGFLAAGLAGSAGAATVSYTGSLIVGIASLPTLSGTGGGVYVGPTHIGTMTLSPFAFGPITEAVPVTSSFTLVSVRLTGVGNLTGSFTGLSGGPPVFGAMGLAGTAKICLIIPDSGCPLYVPVPLSPSGGVGMGIGGTQTVPGAVSLTLKHTGWTVGQPFMTIHTGGSAVTTPSLPGGLQSPFSNTATTSGVLQLVTVTKVYTSLVSAFPEVPVFSVLNLHFFEKAPTFIEVDVDIKPGSDPNAINTDSKGVIPVAILTTDVFDAATVDADSVRFGPAEAEKAHRRPHVEDVDGDGDLDLLLHFRTQDTGIAPGDTEACVTGQTYDGAPIMGCDAVRTVPPV